MTNDQLDAARPIVDAWMRDNEIVANGSQYLLMLELAARAQAAEKQDAARLDFLDSLNLRLNQHYGTVYGWELVLSPNIVRLMNGPGGRGHLAAIDLNDSKARGAKSCREVIDAAMRQGKSDG